jgi:short subunit dehydrogenase-like uncharacterized protein
MAGHILIYGAYGYTGELIARQAVATGLTPVLAGRDADKLAPLARELDLPHVAVSVTDTDGLHKALDGCAAVLNCAGPFIETWKPMTDACLATGTHYLDITGEVDVLSGCAGRDADAKAAGITLMPGTGFDVVPTDCLSAMLADRLPDATRLTLAFKGMSQASRGTATTAISYLGRAPIVRRDGALRGRTGPLFRKVDFGDGPEEVGAISWGDTVTAWHTTGIPNIEVFMKPPADMVALMKLPLALRRLLTGIGRPLIQRRLDAMPPGPDEEARRTGHCTIWGRVENAEGQSVELRLRTTEGYRLTSITAPLIAARAAAGELSTGFRTPAGALGADFILGIDGCEMLS